MDCTDAKRVLDWSKRMLGLATWSLIVGFVLFAASTAILLTLNDSAPTKPTEVYHVQRGDLVVDKRDPIRHYRYFTETEDQVRTAFIVVGTCGFLCFFIGLYCTSRRAGRDVPSGNAVDLTFLSGNGHG